MELMNQKEAAKRLKVHPTTIKKWSRDRGFPTHKIGPLDSAQVVVIWEEVVEWVKSFDNLGVKSATEGIDFRYTYDSKLGGKLD